MLVLGGWGVEQSRGSIEKYDGCGEEQLGLPDSEAIPV